MADGTDDPGKGPRPPADDALALARAVLDGDEGVALDAVAALADRPPVQAFTLLWEAVPHAAPSVRDAIVAALHRIDAEALSLLGRRALESSRPIERLIGVSIVATSESRPAPTLAGSLDDPSEEVRAAALRALLGRRDRSVIDAVGERLRDPLPQIRVLAVEVLVRIEDDRVLPFLLDGARDPDADVRERSRRALVEWRSPAVVDLLLEALGSRSHRRASSELLVEMGEKAWDRLLTELSVAESSLRRVIGKVLLEGGAHDRLIADLDHRQADRRRRAVEALGAMQAADVIGELVQRLQDPAAGVRAKTAEALGEIGGDAAAAALRHAMVADPDMDVVAAIERALRRISGETPNG